MDDVNFFLFTYQHCFDFLQDLLTFCNKLLIIIEMWTADKGGISENEEKGKDLRVAKALTRRPPRGEGDTNPIAGEQ